MKEYYVEKEKDIVLRNGIEFFIQHFDNLQKRVDPHIHAAIEILFITKGNFRVYSESTEYIAREGEMILFRSNTIHRVYPMEKNSIYYVLKLYPAFIMNISSMERGASYLLRLALYNDTSKIVWSKKECEEKKISEFLKRLIEESESKGYCSDLSVKICAGEILLIILRDIGAYEEKNSFDENSGRDLERRIYDAIVYINKHYAEDITAEGCSKELFMSYSYFSRKFKQITGKTFKNYLLTIRINRAEKALMSTEKSITQIATECGFNNLAYFSSVYKKVKGVSPSDITKSRQL